MAEKKGWFFASQAGSSDESRSYLKVAAGVAAIGLAAYLFASRYYGTSDLLKRLRR